MNNYALCSFEGCWCHCDMKHLLPPSPLVNFAVLTNTFPSRSWGYLKDSSGFPTWREMVKTRGNIQRSRECVSERFSDLYVCLIKPGI